MTVTEFVNNLLCRRHTILLCGCWCEDGLWDVLEDGGTVEEYFDHNESYVSIGRYGDYKMDYVLNKELAEAKVEKIFVSGDYIVLTIRTESEENDE